MKKYFQLTVQILRHGSWHGSVQSFNRNRLKSLENFRQFIPAASLPAEKDLPHNVIAQAAFIRSAFISAGGHLAAGNLAYIRIPKAANTSIGFEMLLKKYPELADKEMDETQINFLTDVNLDRVADARPGVFFTVVRNPFARLVSVYRDFFETDHSDFIYQDYLFGILKQKISFAAFVNQISRIPHRLKDQHLRPQNLFIKPYQRTGIEVKVFKLEEHQNLEQFMHAQGMQLRHKNKSAQPYDYAAYYTRALIEKVYTVYARDIETFGYQKVYQDLKIRHPHS